MTIGGAAEVGGQSVGYLSSLSSFWQLIRQSYRELRFHFPRFYNFQTRARNFCEANRVMWGKLTNMQHVLWFATRAVCGPD